MNTDFEIIDTPGLGDSRGSAQDSENINNMVSYLKKLGEVHAFVIVFNGENPRFDEHLKGMIRIFNQIFGGYYFQNAILVFTHWPFDLNAKRRRMRYKDDEGLKIKKFNDLFVKEFAVDVELPCAFLDNSYRDPEFLENCDNAELREFESNVLLIKRFAVSKAPNPFKCIDIRIVKAEKDRLEIEKYNLQRRLEEKEREQKEAERLNNEQNQYLQRRLEEKERERLEEKRKREEQEKEAERLKNEQNQRQARQVYVMGPGMYGAGIPIQMLMGGMNYEGGIPLSYLLGISRKHRHHRHLFG